MHICVRVPRSSDVLAWPTCDTVSGAADGCNMYLPPHRFSGGGGGVYCGVKDLHLSEVSGAFSISLEAVPAAAAGSSGSSAQREARLKVTLSGIATTAGSKQ
jgi:hypothetical protein